MTFKSPAKEPEANETGPQCGSGSQSSSRVVDGRTSTATCELTGVTAGETAPHFHRSADIENELWHQATSRLQEIADDDARGRYGRLAREALEHLETLRFLAPAQAVGVNRVPLADHDYISRKVLNLPWAIQSAIVTIAAHCTVIKDKCEEGNLTDASDLAGCISQDLFELANFLAAQPPAAPVETDVNQIQYVIEGIVLRRLYEKRIEGYTIETAKEIAQAIVSHPRSSADSGDNVIRLEWVEHEDKSEETSYWADHQFGSYAVERDYFSVIPWELVAGGRVVGNFDTVEAAQKAAQDHFEQRVRSCLVGSRYTPAYDPTTQPYDEPFRHVDRGDVIFVEPQPVQVTDEVLKLRAAMDYACDLLAERTYGSSARSPGHNARLHLESALSLSRPQCETQPEAPSLPPGWHKFPLEAGND